jgi:predicted SAM-dependent methyltransferase
MDLGRKWPMPNDCFDGIFCEHVLEHFDYEKGRFVLRECWRILRPGGCLRIIVPDGSKIMRTYFERPGEFPSWRTRESSCAMEAVNSYFRQRYEHQYMYDSQLLKHQVQEAGFAQVEELSFRKSNLSQQMLLDDEKYASESLYLEAIKPMGIKPSPELSS